jgi:hypothetical protein
MKNCSYCGKEIKKKQQKYCNKYCFKNEVKKGKSVWKKQIEHDFKSLQENKKVSDEKNNQ